MASDEEVEVQRVSLVELRARLDEARTGGSETQRELDNELVLTQMQAEEAKLRAELDELNLRNSPAAMVQGAAAPLASAKEQMLRSLAAQAAVAEQAAPAALVEAPAVPAVPDVPAETPKVVSTKKVEG